MENKSKNTRYLIVSLIFVLILCIFVFTFQAVRMREKSAETISDIGGIYMSGMGDHVADLEIPEGFETGKEAGL